MLASRHNQDTSQSRTYSPSKVEIDSVERGRWCEILVRNKFWQNSAPGRSGARNEAKRSSVELRSMAEGFVFC